MREISGGQKVTGVRLRVVALALFTGLVWAIAALFDRDDVVSGSLIVEPTATGPASSAGALRDVDVILAAPNRRALVGRPVQLTGVEVRSVPSDRTLWVGPSRDRVLFIVISNASGAGAAAAERPTARPGDRVTVSGVLRAVPDNLEPWRTVWGLDPGGVGAVRRAQVYLAANRADLFLR